MPLDIDPAALAGRAVRDSNGRLLGDLDVVFGDRATGAPRFGGITTARGFVVVPLEGASAEPEHGPLVLPFGEAMLAGAPRVDPDTPTLDTATELAIAEHFAGESETAQLPRVPDETDELILTEEQALVETERLPTDRVRLRKEVVEEDVTLTVTLRREELVIEREPIDGADAVVGSPDGDAFEPLEIVLWAEEPVVTTRAVPTERVRLRRETVTEDRFVRTTLQRERAEVETETTTGGTTP